MDRKGRRRQGGQGHHLVWRHWGSGRRWMMLSATVGTNCPIRGESACSASPVCIPFASHHGPFGRTGCEMMTAASLHEMEWPSSETRRMCTERSDLPETGLAATQHCARAPPRCLPPSATGTRTATGHDRCRRRGTAQCSDGTRVRWRGYGSALASFPGLYHCFFSIARRCSSFLLCVCVSRA